MTISELLGMIVGGGVIAAIITAISERGKKRAEAADLIASAAATLLVPLDSRVASLEAQLKTMRREGKEKDVLIEDLTAQVEKLRLDYSALSTSGDLKDARISSLESLLRDKDIEIAGLNRRVKELEQEVARLTTENGNLQGGPGATAL